MEFEVWLTERLNAVGVDGEVFSSYISGSLSSLEGSDDAEVEESLLEILQGCLVSGIILLLYNITAAFHWKGGRGRVPVCLQGYSEAVE